MVAGSTLNIREPAAMFNCNYMSAVSIIYEHTRLIPPVFVSMPVRFLQIRRNLHFD